MQALKKIRATAAGNINVIDAYNGYYTWARLGYTIINDGLDEFEQLMKELHLPYTTLNGLMSTYDERKLWKKIWVRF